MTLVTSNTLIDKVKERNCNRAWSRFYELYAPLIFRFACKRGCDSSAAEDVLQETMCQLLRYLPAFNYRRQRGKFRSYLFQIVISCIRKRNSKTIETESVDRFADQPQLNVPDEHPNLLVEQFEKERKLTLIRHALQRIKQRVDPITWKSFELYVLNEGNSAEKVAALLKIHDKNSIYQHKNRIIKLLKDDVKNLEREIGDVEYDEEINDKEYKRMEFHTLTYTGNKKFPRDEFRTRFKLLQKAFSNHPPAFTTESQLLVITQGNSRWEKLDDHYTIGTSTNSKLQLKSGFVSKSHCIIRQNGRQWILDDRDSTNGIVVNGNKVATKSLINGDVIQLGDVILIYLAGNDLNSKETLEIG